MEITAFENLETSTSDTDGEYYMHTEAGASAQVAATDEDADVQVSARLRFFLLPACVSACKIRHILMVVVLDADHAEKQFL